MIQDTCQVRRTAVLIASVCLVLVSLLGSRSAFADERQRERAQARSSGQAAGMSGGQRDSLRQEIKRYSFLGLPVLP